jgi:hypothetical protein
MKVIVVCPFVLFLLAIVLSVLLRYTDSDYLPLVSSKSSYSKNMSSFFALAFVHIICICNILSSLMFICTREDFISLQLVSYPFVLFRMAIKYA